MDGWMDGWLRTFTDIFYSNGKKRKSKANEKRCTMYNNIHYGYMVIPPHTRCNLLHDSSPREHEYTAQCVIVWAVWEPRGSYYTVTAPEFIQKYKRAAHFNHTCPWSLSKKNVSTKIWKQYIRWPDISKSSVFKETIALPYSLTCVSEQCI